MINQKELIDITIRNRVGRLAEDALRPLPPGFHREIWHPTWRDRLRWKLNRIRDAWLMLTGKAEIDG